MIRGFRSLGSEWSAEQLGSPWGDRRAILEIVREGLRDAQPASGSRDLASGGRESPDSPAAVSAPLTASPDTPVPQAAHALPELPALPGSSDEELLWVPGARDGILGSDVEDDEAAAQAARMYTTLRRLLVLGGQERAAEFYRLLVDADAVACVDSLLTLLIEDERILRSPSVEDADGLSVEVAGGSARKRLRAVALWLVRGAPDPEPVKIGLALFGLCAEREDLELLSILGAHEELTLYSAVAIDNAFVDSDPLLWDLAQQVVGWGRIQAVERLSETRDSAVKAWLVREGFRNSISNGYLALTCAEAGDLVGQLDASTIDEDLLIGTSGILIALCEDDGPAETLDHYPSARRLIERFLHHLDRWQPSILSSNLSGEAKTAEAAATQGVHPVGRSVEPILAAAALDRFLARNASDERQDSTSVVSIRPAESDEATALEEQSGVSWSDEDGERFRNRVGELLSSSLWQRVAQAALDRASADRTSGNEADVDDFDLTETAARAVGLDTWELHAERVRAGSSWEAPASWARLFDTDDPNRLARAVRLAEKRFSPESKSDSDSDDSDRDALERVRAVTDEEELHAILEALERHPGLSWPLITIGLDGQSLSLRVLAARALGVWPRDSWPMQGEFLLRRAFRGETSGEVKGLLNELLAG